MVYVQMGRKYYVIEINFDQQGSFDPLEGTMRMSQVKDAFTLSPSSLLIRYSRAKTQNIESAFNKPLSSQAFTSILGVEFRSGIALK